MRDGYRCVMTGRYDLSSLENEVPPAVQGMALMPAGSSIPSPTQLAHVFPPSTNKNIGTSEQEGDKVRLLRLFIDSAIYVPRHSTA